MANGDKYFRALVDANVPQLAGAVAAYYTFNDKPYAFSLALAQVTHTFISRSIAGVGIEFVMDAL